jgi:hypothetical protein
VKPLGIGVALAAACICALILWNLRPMTSAAEAFPEDPELQALARAIDSGDEAQIRAAAAGSDLDGRGRGGIVPLVYAASKQNADAMKLLVELGADPFVNMPNVGSAMSLAASSNNPALLRALIAGGADPSRLTVDDQPVLHNALRTGQFQNVDTLLESGVSPDITDTTGVTGLAEAAFVFNFDAIDMLLDRGADPFAGSWNVAGILSDTEFEPGSERERKRQALLARLAGMGLTPDMRFPRPDTAPE